MNKQPDPVAVAETVLTPLRMLYRESDMKPRAIAVTYETFDAICGLPEIVRELRASHRQIVALGEGRDDEKLNQRYCDARAIARKVLGAEDAQ